MHSSSKPAIELSPGDCIYFDAFMEGGTGPHLHFIVLCIKTNTERCLLIPCTSIRERQYDTTVELNVGDHTFSRHPSLVNYNDAKIVNKADLVRLLVENKATKHDPIGADLLEKIIEGIKVSRFVRPFVREFYTDWRFSQTRKG